MMMDRKKRDYNSVLEAQSQVPGHVQLGCIGGS